MGGGGADGGRNAMLADIQRMAGDKSRLKKVQTREPEGPGRVKGEGEPPKKAAAAGAEEKPEPAPAGGGGGLFGAEFAKKLAARKAKSGE